MATVIDEGMQQRIASAIREMGNDFNPEILNATYALYRPLQERAPKDGVEVVRDLVYGDHPKQRFDLFHPSRKPAVAPVVVYVHGGGFVAGERSPLPGLIYDNVPTFFARNGMVGVNMTYPLAPENKFPAGAADVGRVVDWLKTNAASYGGDPDRIFLMGQSAGATHVAAYSFIASVHGPGGPGNAGAILLSGSYDPLNKAYGSGEPRPNGIAYYGADLSQWPQMCPLSHVRPGHPPVFICVAQFDPYPLAWPSAALLSELVRCDKVLPRFRLLLDHNHVSPAMQINSEVDTLGPDLLSFIRET